MFLQAKNRSRSRTDLQEEEKRIRIRLSKNNWIRIILNSYLIKLTCIFFFWHKSKNNWYFNTVLSLWPMNTVRKGQPWYSNRIQIRPNLENRIRIRPHFKNRIRIWPINALLDVADEYGEHKDAHEPGRGHEQDLVRVVHQRFRVLSPQGRS